MNQKVRKGILRWQPWYSRPLLYFERTDLELRTPCFWSKDLSFLLIRICGPENSDEGRVPCLPHKPSPAWFQVPLPLAGLPPRDGGALPFRAPAATPLFPPRSHSPPAGMARLASGSCLSLGSLGCSLALHFSADPRAALPLGNESQKKGREHRKGR